MSGRDGGPIGRREVAYRLFATEYEDADLEYSDSAEERAPNYVVTPTGARVNRLFVVGVLTEVEPVSEDVLRARVVDPTGAFVIYAGQYQPEAVAFLEDAEVPSFVAVTGKARTFQPDGSDRVFTSVRPESITPVDAATRDRWTVQAAEHTIARIATMADGLGRAERGDDLARALEAVGVEPGLAAGVALAIDHYGTGEAYLGALRAVAIGAAQLVIGDREAVPELDADPADAGTTDTDLRSAPAVAGTLTGQPVTGARATEAEPADAEAAAGPTGPAAASPAPDDGTGEAAAADADPGSAETEDRPASDVEVETPTEPTGGAPAGADDDPGDVEPGVGTAEPTDEPYEMDAAEREAVEAEFGTEFSTGSEVDEPGEAGIETETEPPATEAAGGPDAAEDEPKPTEPEPAADPAGDPDEQGATEEAGGDATTDLEDAAVAAMADLDEGDGAPREAVVAAVAEAHGADPDAIESAIQAALMGGRCYEPADGRLKAI